MALVKMLLRPGVNTQLTQVANPNGYFASNLIRWRNGLLEKMAGWLRLLTSATSIDFIRVLHAWLDLSNNKNLLLGTDSGPQLLINSTLYSLSIIRGNGSGGANTNSVTFTSAIGSPLVTVNAGGSSLAAGQTFTTLMRLSIGGIIIPVGTTFTITSSTGSTFVFNMGSNATSLEVAVPGIPRLTFDPSLTTGLVTFNAHGLAPAGSFTFDQTTVGVYTAAGGVGSVSVAIPAGSIVVVVAAPTANTFTFDRTPFNSSFGLTASTISLYEGQIYTTADGLPTNPNILSFAAFTPAIVATSTDWFADNLGETGLMLYSGSPLLAYVPPIANGAYLVTVVGEDTSASAPFMAPQVNAGMFTAMPQAQVIVFGTEAIFGSNIADPLLVRFSDAGSYQVWTASVINQAGSFRLSRGSKIVGGIQSPQTTLLLTDTDAWSMSYIGPPLIYGFTIAGRGCGLVAARAIGTLGRTTYWMARNQFWQFGEGGVRPLPCDVWDKIFLNLDEDNISKCFAAPNSAANEIAFWFPPANAVLPTPSDNLLLYSQQFNNDSVWVPFGLLAFPTFTAPDTTVTAMKLVESSQLSGHGIQQVIRKDTSSLTITFSVYAHKNSTRSFAMILSALSSGCEVVFNPVLGTTLATLNYGTGWTLTGSGAETDALATGLAGNGWLRYYITATSDIYSAFGAGLENVTGTVTTFYTGDGASGPILWGASVSYGGSRIPYDITTAGDSNEPTSFVKYNPVEGAWDYGDVTKSTSATRTAWIDNNIFGPPLGGDRDFRIQQHETGFDDDDDAMRGVFCESGYATLGDGTQIMSVDQCQPDMKWFGYNGGVKITFNTLMYPGSRQQSYGPFSATPTTQFFNPRFRGRFTAVRYDWAPIKGFSARIGAPSVRLKPAGTRP